MRLRTLSLTGGLLAALLLAAPGARADFTLTLTPSASSLAPGGSLTLLALLFNSTVNTVLLNSPTGTLSGPASSGLDLNDSSFLNSLPLSLGPGGSYSNTLLLSAPAGAALGPLAVQYEVTGYTDPADPGGPQVAADATANLSVARPRAASVPEGSPLWLAVVGASLSLALRSRRRPAARQV